MGGMFGSTPGGGEQAIHSWVRAAQVKAARYERMAAEVEQVRQTASSARGEVSVTVAASGVVTDLVLRDGVRSWDPERIAAEVLLVMRRAQGQLAVAVAPVVTSMIGDDEVTTTALVDGYSRRFPLVDPDGAEPSPPGARPTERDNPDSNKHGGDDPDDDDYFSGGLLR